MLVCGALAHLVLVCGALAHLVLVWRARSLTWCWSGARARSPGAGLARARSPGAGLSRALTWCWFVARARSPGAGLSRALALLAAAADRLLRLLHLLLHALHVAAGVQAPLLQHAVSSPLYSMPGFAAILTINQRLLVCRLQF